MAAGAWGALMEIEDLDVLLVLLFDLPIDPREKKYILIQWCQMHGVALDRDMVERAGAA
jgi:hypothetical protein